jgi:hypothetical protein
MGSFFFDEIFQESFEGLNRMELFLAALTVFVCYLREIKNLSEDIRRRRGSRLTGINSSFLCSRIFTADLFSSFANI